MDRKEIEKFLSLLEKQILESQEYIANQRRLIAELEEAGRDTALAQKWLLALVSLLQIQKAELDRFRNELDKPQ